MNSAMTFTTDLHLVNVEAIASLATPPLKMLCLWLSAQINNQIGVLLFSFQGAEKRLIVFTKTTDALSNKPVGYYEYLR